MNTAKKKTSSGKRGKNKGAVGQFVERHSLAIIIVASVAVSLVVAASLFTMPTYSGESTTVRIPRESSTAAVKDSLKSSLGSAMGNRVYILWRLQGGNVNRSRGYYEIVPGTSAGKISRRIVTGSQSPVKVQFNATRGMERLAKTITRNLDMTPGEFLDACEKVLPDSGFKVPQFQAAFIPDTYEFYATIEPEALVKRLLEYRNKFWTEDRRKLAAQLGMTPEQVATLESIVEEETAKPDERPLVASLYLNRLYNGIKLQADPTVKYAMGDESIRRITRDMLFIDSPYNTYLYRGLPPGPIRVPERSTLDDVLQAPVTDYLYMCAREDFSGYHNFTHSYSIHCQNAARYRAELDKRGIK